MNKLFNNHGSDENTYSKEDMVYLIDKCIEKSNLEISLLEAKVLLEEVSLENDDYIDKWKEFCTVTGMEFDHKISKEALVSKKEGTTSLITRFTEGIMDTFSNINTVLHTFAGYDVDKVERLMNDIESGKLIPRKEINRVTMERLQDKWSPFFVFSNSLSKSQDIIDYLKEPVDHILSGDYDDFITKHWKIAWSVDSNESKRFKSVQLDLKKLKMQLKIKDVQKEDVIISFLIKRFGPKLNMYSFLHTNDLGYEDKSGLDVKHPFFNNIDILNIPSKYVETIKPLPKEEMLKVLKWLIDSNRDIKKAITEAKILFHKYNAKNYILNVVTSVTPYVGITHQILAARAFNSLITHIGNVSKDMIYYDDLINELVNAMYETK